MADWIGQFLAGVPEWLFLPLLILVIVLSIVVYLIYALGESVWLGKPLHSSTFRSKKSRKG